MKRFDQEHGAADLVGGMILSGVISAAIALVLVAALSSPLPGKVPVVDLDVTNTTNTLFLTHRGGDTLLEGEYQILIAGQDQTAAFTKQGTPAGNWFAGDTLEYPIPESGMPKSLTIVFTGSGQSEVLLEIYL